MTKYKTTRWYKTGERIPGSGVYIKTEMKETGSQKEYGPRGVCEEIPVYTEMHLYEIPLEVGEVERKIEESGDKHV